MRFDAIRFVQEQMDIYKDKLKIDTPNLDRLAQEGVYFPTAYSEASMCVPARATLRTGCTMQRTGMLGNDYSK